MFDTWLEQKEAALRIIIILICVNERRVRIEWPFRDPAPCVSGSGENDAWEGQRRPADVCLWFCDVSHLNPVSVLIRLNVRVHVRTVQNHSSPFLLSLLLKVLPEMLLQCVSFVNMISVWICIGLCIWGSGAGFYTNSSSELPAFFLLEWRSRCDPADHELIPECFLISQSLALRLLKKLQTSYLSKNLGGTFDVVLIVLTALLEG